MMFYFSCSFKTEKDNLKRSSIQKKGKKKFEKHLAVRVKKMKFRHPVSGLNIWSKNSSAKKYSEAEDGKISKDRNA